MSSDIQEASMQGAEGEAKSSGGVSSFADSKKGTDACSSGAEERCLSSDRRLVTSDWRHLVSLRLCRPSACVRAKSLQSCLTLCDPMDCSRQTLLSPGFPRQESWSGLPFLSPGDLPDPGIQLVSPDWQMYSLPLSHLGRPVPFRWEYKLVQPP